MELDYGRMRADLCSGFGYGAIDVQRSSCTGRGFAEIFAQHCYLLYESEGLCNDKAVLNVLAFYYEMKGRDVECNAITYNTMPNTLVHCCEMQCAPRILEDMRDESLLMEPDMITYSMIMKEYVPSGDLDKGFLLLKQMEEGCSFSRMR